MFKATSPNEKVVGQERPLRKFKTTLPPGTTEYLVQHDLGTRAVIVQASIAGRVREGGITIADENTVRVTFGGNLNEPLDLVIIG